MKIKLEELLSKAKEVEPPPFRRNFITGLITLAPVLITLYVIWTIVAAIGGKLASILSHFPLLRWIPSFFLTIISLIFLIFIIYLVGIFSSSFIGREILNYGEILIEKIPFIRSIYVGTKQLVNAFSVQNRKTFTKAVLVEFPYKGSYVIGFITNSEKWRGKNTKFLNVFIPTTPNPTSGWYIIVEESRVKYLDIGIEDAIKMVVSGGLVTPPEGSGKIENAMDQENPMQH